MGVQTNPHDKNPLYNSMRADSVGSGAGTMGSGVLQYGSGAVRCGPVRSDAVNSHTPLNRTLRVSVPNQQTRPITIPPGGGIINNCCQPQDSADF